MALYIDSAFLNDIMHVTQIVPLDGDGYRCADRRCCRAFYARLTKDE